MIKLGIYEKGLPRTDWDTFFASVAQAGFSFTDLSLDESPERSSRLMWSEAHSRRVAACARRHGVQIGGLCVSLHRKIGPGSIDRKVRSQAGTIFRQAIDLCAAMGIPVAQVAGYYAYYETPDAGQRERYIETLSKAADYAALSGVMLGIENVDGHDVTSISDGVAVCDEVKSAWLQMYPDIGNLTVQGLDATTELRAGRGRMVALHAKDAKPGMPRRIAMGTGAVDFPGAFAELARQSWSGRLMLELWNDDAPDSAQRCVDARHKIEGWLAGAGLTVATAKE